MIQKIEKHDKFMCSMTFNSAENPKKSGEYLVIAWDGQYGFLYYSAKHKGWTNTPCEEMISDDDSFYELGESIIWWADLPKRARGVANLLNYKWEKERKKYE